MPHLFAHSENQRNKIVRHLRQAIQGTACYERSMTLRIKELRLARGKTLQELAAMTSISKSHLSEIENGKKKVNNYRLEQIAAALGVPAVELLGGAEVPDDLAEHLHVMQELSPEDRAAVIRHALGLLRPKPQS